MLVLSCLLLCWVFCVVVCSLDSFYLNFFVTIEVGCLTFVGHYFGSSDCFPALMLRILHADMGVLHVRLCLKLLGSNL